MSEQKDGTLPSSSSFQYRVYSSSNAVPLSPLRSADSSARSVSSSALADTASQDNNFLPHNNVSSDTYTDPATSANQCTVNAVETVVLDSNLSAESIVSSASFQRPVGISVSQSGETSVKELAPTVESQLPTPAEPPVTVLKR